MVSPYKKKKLDKKARQPPVEINAMKYTGSRRTRTSVKPLTDKKFYLDIKNHASLKKIEAKLTSLGARLELFLVREVDYVVTDREDYPRAGGGGGRHQTIPTPSPLPSFCSVSPATPISPHDGLAVKRTRSRAEAMLERVKNQPTKNTGDILDNAVTWRIPIYPLSRFISWLEKVAKRTEKLYDTGGRIIERGVKELRGTYLKVETTARPEFRQFKSWPAIGVTHKENNIVNQQQHNKIHSNEYQRMTRKVGKAAKEASSAPGGGNGYCEMCRIHYDHLDNHVTSVEHLKLVTDPSQYSHLDSIIAQHNLGVSSVRKSLRIAKSPPPYLPPEMGGRQSSESVVNNVHHHATATANTTQINGHVTRSKTAASTINNSCQQTPTVHAQCNGVERRRSKTHSRGDTPPRHGGTNNETTPSTPATATASPYPEHNLRPRRSLHAVTPSTLHSNSLTPQHSNHVPLASPVSLTTANKELSPPPPPPPPSSNCVPTAATPTTPTNQTIIKPILPPPRRTSRVIRKRLSVEEKLIEDNKSYYKVEVLSSKLRSTEYFITQNKVETQARINGTVPGTVVVQQDNKTTNKSPEKAPVVVRFKKVRKTELAVLSDEAESFMFGEPKKAASVESSDSSEDDEEDDDEDEDDSGVGNNNTVGGIVTGSGGGHKSEPDVKTLSLPILHPPSSPPALNCTAPASPPHLMHHIKDDPEDVLLREIMFSFDKAPHREPWLETYRRQDEGKEMYIPQYHSYPSVLLPYQVPQEKHYKRLMGSAGGLYGSSRRRDRLAKLLDDRPRKSPRCHASTLAIMSSLMRRHRPGRECERPFTYEEDSSLASDIIESSSNSERLTSQAATTTTTITTVPNSSAVHQVILSAVLNPECTDRIGEALINGKTEISTIEPCLSVDPKAISDGVSFVNIAQGLNMDVLTLIDTYQQCTSLEVAAIEQAPPRPFESVRFGADSCASSDCSDLFGFLDDGRVVSKKRKRKRNMTGWPQPKRRIVTPSSTAAAAAAVAAAAAATSSSVKDILADQPPVDVNQFECVQGVTSPTVGVGGGGDDDGDTTPLFKRRGRPPKVNRSIIYSNSRGDSPPGSETAVISTTPIVSTSTPSPVRRKVHRFFAHRKSLLK